MQATSPNNRSTFLVAVGAMLTLTLPACSTLPGKQLDDEIAAIGSEQAKMNISHEVIDKPGSEYTGLEVELTRHLYRAGSTKAEEQDTRCHLQIDNHFDGAGTACLVGGYAAFFTAFVLPSYCPKEYTISAELQSPMGDTLKTYTYKERADHLVHISGAFFAPNSLDDTAHGSAETRLARVLLHNVSKDLQRIEACHAPQS